MKSKAQKERWAKKREQMKTESASEGGSYHEGWITPLNTPKGEITVFNENLLTLFDQGGKSLSEFRAYITETILKNLDMSIFSIKKGKSLYLGNVLDLPIIVSNRGNNLFEFEATPNSEVQS